MKTNDKMSLLIKFKAIHIFGDEFFALTVHNKLPSESRLLPLADSAYVDII